MSLRLILADRLVESIERNVDASITQAHLATVKRRRDEIRSGMVEAVDGEEALARVRASLRA